MGDVSKDWRLIAADMIDARHFELSGDADIDGPEMVAASFVFNEGIYYLGDEGMAEVSKMLRSASHNTPRKP